MKRMHVIAALLMMMLALYLPSQALAEGFALYEWSASGAGMGNNYMFGEEDPAVLAYNPAQITKLNGTYFSFGFSWYSAHTKARFNDLGPVNSGMRSDSWDTEYDPAFAPYMYFVTKSGENSWWGIGIFSRFGNQIEYDDLWPGRFDTIYSGLKGITIQPTYAFKINSKLSAAVGLDINYVNLRMQKANLASAVYSSISPSYDLYSDLDGNSTSLGWVASLMYDFTPKTSIAVVYRSRVKHTMDADMEFESALLPALGYPSTKYGTSAHGNVTLPDSLAIGLGHKFDNRTRVELTATWTNWKTYNALNVGIDNFMTSSSDSQKNWNDVWRFGIGIEHKLNKRWSVLCGYVYDQSPTPDNCMDFTIPTGNRNLGSIGLKYRPNDHSEVSFAYTGIWAGSRDTPSHAYGYDYSTAHIYDGFTQVLSLGYNIKLK